MCHGACVEVVWVLGSKFKWPVLVRNAFTCWGNLLTLALIFGVRSLTEPGAHCLARLEGLQAPGIRLPSHQHHGDLNSRLHACMPNTFLTEAFPLPLLDFPEIKTASTLTVCFSSLKKKKKKKKRRIFYFHC